MTCVAGGLVVLAAALSFGACIHDQPNDVTTIGPRRARLPADCPVQVFPGQPPYPIKAVAKVRVPACGTNPRGHSACGLELRALACAYGADTVFGVSEAITGEWATRQSTNFAGGDERDSFPQSNLFATLAVKTGDAPAACAPICSPGFACEAGRCVPQCNPACETGEVCTRRRVCEPSGS